MSLARAFTTRRVRMSNELAEAHKSPRRSNTTTGKANKASQNMRLKISAPIQLVHTTNMLSYNAPDLPNRNRSNSANKSDDETASQATLESTPPTSPDVEADEKSSMLDVNEPSGYFSSSEKAKERQQGLPIPDTVPELSTPPAIPHRSPSHTKKNSFETMGRQKSARLSKGSRHTSISSKQSQTFSRTSSTSTVSSTGHTSAPYPQKSSSPPIPSTPTMPTLSPVRPPRDDLHPFGQELAQVSELAEVFGSKQQQLKVVDEDGAYLQENSLCKWNPSDYLGEISSLYSSFFPEASAKHTPTVPLWI